MNVKLEHSNEYNSLKSQAYEALSLLRDELEGSDLALIFLFFALKKEGILNESGVDQISYTKLHLNLIIDEKVRGKDENYFIEEAFDIYNREIESLNQVTISKLIEKLNKIPSKTFSKYYPQLFDELLNELSSLQGKHFEFFQPFELTELVYELADIKSRNLIYNPFAGTASLATLVPENTLYVGEEINKKIYVLGNLRLHAYNKRKNAFLLKGDSINNWNSNKNEYDLIFGFPPIGHRITEKIEGHYGQIKTAEHFLIEKGIESLSSTGKLIAIVSPAFLFKEGPESKLRELITTNFLLESIISIPGGLLKHTSIPLCIIVLSKSKKNKGIFRFIDAKNYIIPKAGRQKVLDSERLCNDIKKISGSESIKDVFIEKIKKLNFNLSPALYSKNEVKGTPLSNLVLLARGGKPTPNEVGKFIRIRDLSEDLNSVILDITKVESVTIPRHAVKITESVILVALRWSKLKPTYFKYTGEPIYVSQDITAIIVNENKVSPEFLANEMMSGYVEEQAEAFRTSSVIPYLRRQDILMLEIDLPSLDKQQYKLIGLKQAIVQEKQKEVEYLRKIHGLQSEIHEQNAFLRHTLSGPATNIKGAFTNITTILENQVKAIVGNLMNLKVSPEHNLNMENYLEILNRDINRIAEAVKRTTEVQSRIMDKELYPVDILAFLRQYTKEVEEVRKNEFSILLQVDDDIFKDEEGNEVKIFIKGNEELLTDLLNNFVNNAVKHAFSTTTNNRVELFITADTDETEVNKTDIILLISNTGKELSEDFNLDMFCQKGGRLGDNSGEGMGGYIIFEIVKYLNGKLDYINEQGSEGLPGTDLSVSFEITFPIIPVEKDEKI